MKKKIAIIVGTRPEVIKLAPLYLELKHSKKFKPILINTGQHLEMTSQMLKWFNIKEDINLKIMKRNQSLEGITSTVLQKTSKALKEIKPSLVIVEGDTSSVMAASLAAFYLKIPIAHVEAGLRTDDIYNPFPEEMSRRLVSRLATYHFAPTELAAKNLKREGITKNIFLTGNTVIDALLYTKNKIKEQSPPSSPSILVTMHRRENLGKPHRDIAKTLIKLLNKHKDLSVLLPLHKNPKVRKEISPILKDHKRVTLTEPLDYVPFVTAMMKSTIILTDSGGIQEEAPTLGKPTLVLRTTTERPEGIKAGCAKLVGISPERVFHETDKLLTNKTAYKKMSAVKNPYGDGKSAKKIISILNRLI